jgi:hypothetical protein
MNGREGVHPRQVLADDELLHHRVVRIGHGDQPHLQTVTASHPYHFLGIVIGH